MPVSEMIWQSVSSRDKFTFGGNMERTPEGFLICRNVPIARTGSQMYLGAEVPITPRPDGTVTIYREEEEVFADETIRSFEGKPVTIIHPDQEVTPITWKEVAVGHAQNVRRGDGVEADAMIADLLIMEERAINCVLNHEYRELSCGYDADYVELGVGEGKQKNIRGNHIALVERGRCGSLCSIRDEDSTRKEIITMPEWLRDLLGKMPKTDEAKKMVTDALGVKDAGTLTVDQRLEKIEGLVMKLVKDAEESAKEEEEEEVKKKTAEDKKAKDAEEEEEKKKKGEGEDCNQMKDAAPIMQDILYRSSILAPALSRPTMDAITTMDRKTFDDTCCKLKRRSLDAAYNTEAGKASLTPFMGTYKPEDFFTMDCKSLDMIFIGASEVMKKTNDAAVSVKAKVTDFGKPVSVADINKRNAEFWAKGGK